MSWCCPNVECKRNNKPFLEGNDGYFSMMQHCSTSWECWQNLNPVHRDWWIQKGYPAPEQTGASSSQQESMSINVNIGFTLDMNASDTVGNLKEKIIQKLKASSVQIYVHDDIPRDGIELDKVLTRKKKNVHVELITKPLAAEPSGKQLVRSPTPKRATPY